jgi:hypothetical protein
MLRKSTLLAVAASAAFGLVAFNPVSASAHGGGHWGGGGGHWGGHGYHHFHPHYGWRRPIVYPRPVVYTAVRPATATAGPCTCLSKEYTPEGAVVFKDRCTNEMAMNPPPAPPQQTGALEPQPPVK